MAAANGETPYRLSFLAAADEKLRALARRAAARGLAAEFVRDLEYLRRRLRGDPADWGDRLDLPVER